MGARSELRAEAVADRVAPTDAHGAVRAQRLAWTVMLLAFAVWSVLVVSTVVAVRNYVDQASDSPPATLRVVDGIVFVEAPGDGEQRRARPDMPVSEGAVVEASPGSSADVALFDGTVAHLLPGTRVRLASLRIGKFNDDLTRIALEPLRGPLILRVSARLPREKHEVRMPHGTALLAAGEYLVWPAEDRTRIVAYEGSAVVQSGSEQRELAARQRIELTPEGLLGPLPSAENLVFNGDFSRGFDGWQPIHRQEQGKEPDEPGSRALRTVEIGGQQTSALHVSRKSRRQTHNETGLLQEIYRDVSGYRHVYVRAWVKVNHASLSGGGAFGFEYPMVILVEYVDGKGGQRPWSHGFFYQNEENRPTTFGEQVPQGAWYLYEGDLATLEDRPFTIKTIQVFASGHDFDAEVARVEIVVE